MNSVEYPLWAWILFFVVVLVALSVDLGIVNRKAHAPTRTRNYCVERGLGFARASL